MIGSCFRIYPENIDDGISAKPSTENFRMSSSKNFILILLLLAGCASVSNDKAASSHKEAVSAIQAVAGSLSGKNVVAVRYCPIDGERFSSRVQFCPTHHLALKDLEE